MHLPQRKCRQSNRPSTTKAFWSLNSCVMNLLRVTWKSWEKRYEQLLFSWIGDLYIFKTKLMNWAPSFLLLAPLEFNMTMLSCHNSRCPFIQTAGWNRSWADDGWCVVLTGTAKCFAYLFILCISSAPSSFSRKSCLMATPSMSRSPSVLLMMLIFLSTHFILPLLLLLLVHIMVIFAFVVLIFLTRFVVATFVVVVMHHFFGDTGTCMVIVKHLVVHSRGVIHSSIKGSCCLNLVASLLKNK